MFKLKFTAAIFYILKIDACDPFPVVDQDRSCAVTVSKAPLHMIASSDSQRKCATKDQPWVIEAPAGQKIKVTLIDFLASQTSQNDDNLKRSCLGVIVDNASKRNVSICVGGEQRTRFLYSSKADSLEIYYNTQGQKDSKDAKKFVLKLEGSIFIVYLADVLTILRVSIL